MTLNTSHAPPLWFGLLIMAQMPHLAHSNALAHVSKHLHILPTWSGRKILEWSEYTSNPRSLTNRQIAVTKPYSLPKESYSLYHSATQHTKVKRSIPMQLYFFCILMLALPIVAYIAYDRIYSRVSHSAEQPEEITVSHETNTLDVQLLTRSINWSQVSACIASPNSCICYGLSAERLAESSCQLAVSSGWAKNQSRKQNQLDQI